MAKPIADPKDVTVEYVEPKKKTPVRGSVKTSKSWVTNLKKKVDAEFEKTRQERKKTIYKILHDAGISDEEIKTIKGP
jgi:hypothetical protein